MRALEVDKQSSLAEMVKSESAGDAGQDHHGENLSFAVFNSQSKVVLDMHREELVHVESSASTPEMLLKMPLASISGVVDKQGSARESSSPMSPASVLRSKPSTASSSLKFQCQ